MTNSSHTDGETEGAAGNRENSPALGDIFPFDSPYEAQKDAIRRLSEIYRKQGIAVLEGACGTGKTLSALTPAIQAVRDDQTRYERVIVITSVKQQLRAFEEDGQAINANLPDDVPSVQGLSLVGKEDLCPYASEGMIDSDEFYRDCEDLRDPVRRAGTAQPGPREKIGVWESLANEASTGNAPLEGDEWMAPYQAGIPEDDAEESYCPFYAAFRAEAQKDGDGYHPHGIMTPPEMLAAGADQGFCPHALMRHGLENAEILISNYYHVFDPVTVQRLTSELIGPETILIVDEAHGIEESVRELLSDEISRFSIERAINEVEQIVESDSEFANFAEEELREAGVQVQQARTFVSFLNAILRWIDNRALDNLEGHDSDWLDKIAELPDEFEDSLREPDTPERDDLSEWVEDEDIDEKWEQVSVVGEAVADALTEAAKEVGSSRENTYADTVGRVLGRWRSCGHEQYFRQFVLEKRERIWDEKNGWKQAYRSRLKMQNCIPSEPIAERLDQFGSVVLMSATLAPLNVYREVVGVDKLAEQGRPIEEMVYGLDFPEENRRTLGVDTTPFTGKNRGSPEWEQYWDEETETVREEYADVIRDVVTTTPGNVLICMPSYAEAKWSGDLLEEAQNVEKEILIDESSSEEATEELKEEFFSGDAKVLCTGLRGTLTEGVDYDGDRLAATVVCGVPIRGLGGDYPDAIKTAYERRFGENNGFEYAFTVPAVRKSRQAIGRVIRGDDEVGVRVYADARYVDEWRWNGVRDYLPDYALNDLETASPNFLKHGLRQFWSSHQA